MDELFSKLAITEPAPSKLASTIAPNAPPLWQTNNVLQSMGGYFLVKRENDWRLYGVDNRNWVLLKAGLTQAHYIRNHGKEIWLYSDDSPHGEYLDFYDHMRMRKVRREMLTRAASKAEKEEEEAIVAHTQLS